MKKKRIAFFLGSMGRGGAEKVISVLSREYAEKGNSNQKVQKPSDRNHSICDIDVCNSYSYHIAFA